MRRGYEIRVAFSHVTIRKDGHVIVRGKKVDDMYQVMLNNNTSISSYLFVSTFISPYTWHLRLGHINKDKLLSMGNTGLLPNFEKVDFGICEPCILGKMTKKPFKKSWNTKESLEIVHSDICGPLRVMIHRGM